MTRALVIGGTGFLGLAVVDALLARGIDVSVSRRKRSITLLAKKRPVTFVPAELEDRRSLAEAMRGVDVAYMMAGHYPRYSLDAQGAIDQGVLGIRNVCAAALEAGLPRLVYASSTASLAKAPFLRPADEDDIPAECPRESTYRAVKWHMERELEAHIARGLPAVTTLPGGCFGPGDLRVGTGGILVGTVTGRLPWYVEGVIPFVDVDDVADAHAALATHAAPAARYCLAGHWVRVSTLLKEIAARFGGRAPHIELGPEAARETADRDERRAAPRRERVPVPRELVDIVLAGQPVSSQRAAADLGFKPRPLEETLDRSHAWFLAHGLLNPQPLKEARCP